MSSTTLKTAIVAKIHCDTAPVLFNKQGGLDAHVTFAVSDKECDLSLLESALQPALAKRSSIVFKTDNVIMMPPSSIHKGWYAFLLFSKGFFELYQLYDELFCALDGFNYYSERPYIPHITLGKFDSYPEGKRFINGLTQSEIHLSGCIETIDCIHIDNYEPVSTVSLTLGSINA
jgi:hypothetical protein